LFFLSRTGPSRVVTAKSPCIREGTQGLAHVVRQEWTDAQKYLAAIRRSLNSRSFPRRNYRLSPTGRSPGLRVSDTLPFPFRNETVVTWECCPNYSGGTAPESHRLPFSPLPDGWGTC